MNLVKENRVVPKLRFKEFNDIYKLSNFGDEVKLFNGYAFSSNDSTERGVKWVKIADVGINVMKMNNSSYLPLHYKIDYKKFLLHEGDYVVALTRPILSGKLKIAKIDSHYNSSLLNQRVGKLESENDLDYIYFFLQRNIFIRKIENRISGSEPPNLSPSEISSLKIFLPEVLEQQKIASFLNNVEKKLKQLSKKKELLEDYKKGIIQKIFSKDIRFKDDNGNYYPDWKHKKLGDLGETYNGLTGKTKGDFGLGQPFIEYMQVFNSPTINVSNFGYVYVSENEKQNTAKYGDIFFTTSSETPMEVGFSSVLNDKIEGIFLNSFCFGYRPYSLEELHPEYSAYLFRCQPFRKQITKLAQGSTRYNMSKIQLLKIEVQIPILEEQKKIGQFLSSIDKKIEFVSTQIEKTKEFKKGLLQQMFV